MYFCDMTVKRHMILRMDEDQIYVAPHPLLKNYVAHYTIYYSKYYSEGNSKVKIAAGVKRGSENEAEELTIIPDSSGCVVCTYEENSFSSCLWGPTTKAVKVTKDAPSVRSRFFIEFMPGGLSAVTGIKQMELCDIISSTADIDDSLAYELTNILETSENVDDTISRVNLTLLKALEKNNRIHYIISSALDRISSTGGILTVGELASEEHVSQRHLNRLFNEYVGMGTKMFLRISRINNSIKLFKFMKHKSNLDLSQRLGFYDEAHFIHDFQQICGVSPRAFLNNMSDFYNEPFKY